VSVAFLSTFLSVLLQAAANMPSKSSLRARRRPASPRALPVELIAKILENLRVYDGPYAPPKDHGIDDLAACALVSRVWHRAANQDLYRHLTIQVTTSEAEEPGSEDEEDDESDINRVITTNSHLSWKPPSSSFRTSAP